MTMDIFINLLTNWTSRPIIDKTGLTGSYDIKLEWMLDTAPDGTLAAGPEYVTITIEEQLGLRLIPAKGPVEVLVIRASRNIPKIR